MKILTALNNKDLYNKLREELKQLKQPHLIHKDIVYKEGIIEFLTINKDVDLIIFNTNLEGTIDNFLLIKQILELNKYIEIIIIIDQDDIEFRRFLSSYNINKVLIEGNFILEDLLVFITNNKNIRQKLIEKELEELKQLVFGKEKTFKQKILNKIKNFKTNNKNIDKTNKTSKAKKNKDENKNNNKVDKKIVNKLRKKIKIKKKKKIYFSLSEELQKYNIDSIDITINIRK